VLPVVLVKSCLEVINNRIMNSMRMMEADKLVFWTACGSCTANSREIS
jgi:hypothetical protein